MNRQTSIFYEIAFRRKRQMEKNEEEKYADSISGDLMGDEKWIGQIV